MFDSEKKAEGLDTSTFDIVKIDSFHNTRFWTVLSFVWVWIVLILKIAILGGDTYTCVSILVFNRWGTLDYDVYEYKVAKWIFTGCIFFRFLLLAYQIAWGIHVYRTRNIALAYLNHYARLMYAIRSYNYQCLFHEIDQEGFFEWACFHVYTELDNALEVLVADLPRQVINFMTLRYYATDGDLNNAILTNIKSIATTNLRLSIILSFQLCTMVLFLFFFFKFLLAIVLYIPIKVKVAHRGFRLLKAFCYKSVNENVRFLVKRNHKPRTQILNEGLMDIKEIQANLLLASNSTFDSRSWLKPLGAHTFDLDFFDTTNSSTAEFYDQSLGDGSFRYYPLKESLAVSHTLPQESYAMLSLRENPFEDSEAPGVSDLSHLSGKTQENPFADNFVKNAAAPVRILPPIRSQTSESLLSLRTAKVSLGMRSDDIVGSDHRLQISDLASLRNESSNSLGTFGNEASSDTRLLQGALPPLASSMQRSSGISEDLSDNQSCGTPQYNNDTSDRFRREISKEGYLDVSKVEDDNTPYPVRGVSQYFDKNDV